MNRPKILIVSLIAGIIAVQLCSCVTQRPESPYYLNKKDAVNKQERKLVKSYNQLVADYTTVVNDEGDNLTGSLLRAHGKDLKDFSEKIGTAARKQEISYGLMTKIRNNLKSMGKDLIDKFKEKLPTSPDMIPLMKGLMEL
ncbi:MAG: hypothetical protein J6Y79_01490 [Paludibacteraceae bacterium]|nr:hypothetical protein [Paludibacteraceae bacterium]